MSLSDRSTATPFGTPSQVTDAARAAGPIPQAFPKLDLTGQLASDPHRTTSATAQTDDEDNDPPLLPHLDPLQVVRAAPPWLVSLLMHMLLLVIMALWFIPIERRSTLEISLSYSDELGDQLDEETVLFTHDATDATEQLLTPLDLPPVEAPLFTPPALDTAAIGVNASSDSTLPQVGLALTGREEGMKEVLLAAYGGNERTERAVADGLDWLKRQQLKDGSWSLSGPYSDGCDSENVTSATAMAMIAFQGAGHTHQAGAHQAVMNRAVKALLKMQEPNGDFFQGRVAHHRLYSQAQAMIAICELYGMSNDSQLRLAAQKSVDYAVKIQDSLGGWRYRPGSDSDTSVTGWFVMGLQSARMAGLDVPSESLEKVNQYLDRAASANGSRYSYQPGMPPTPSMTAEGLLCRQYLGWRRDDPALQLGVKMLEAYPLTWDERDAYYWYYATQVMHHMEGDAWESWNRVMRDVLPREQTVTGAEKGSWSPAGDRWGPQAGRLYVTCLHLYMLEIYYRHLPIYSSSALTTTP